MNLVVFQLYIRKYIHWSFSKFYHVTQLKKFHKMVKEIFINFSKQLIIPASLKSVQLNTEIFKKIIVG